MSLAWKNETRAIEQLKPFKFNPRKITESQLEKLKKSIETSGYNAPILIDADNTIVAGHQRWFILKELGHKQVDIRLPSRKLTESEFKQINIQDNVSFGVWDPDILQEHFDVADLIEWGVTDIDFNVPGEIEDISEVIDINESVNFAIRCDNLDQLAELKQKLGVNANKISYDEFLQCLKK